MAGFPTTRWSRVVQAGGDHADPGARDALAELCAAYWYPIYAFIRGRCHDAEDAADLTQEYFTRLLEKGVLAGVDRHRGRFRAFLRTDCSFFLSDQRDRREAGKRGGRAVVLSLSIDRDDAEDRYRLEPVDTLTPDRLFDRAWTLVLLEQVMGQLGREYADSGRGGLFEGLKAVLIDAARGESYAELGRRLGLSESAVEGAARRLRGRYRELLRRRIAATLEDPSDLDDEIGDLFTALRR